MPFIRIIIGIAAFTAMAFPALAQDKYVPPPMFDDSLRPESTTGNLVEPRVSPREGTVIAPVVPVAPIAPVSPKMMQPIVEGQPKPAIAKRLAPDAPALPKVKAAEKPKQTAPKTSSIPAPPKKPEPPKAIAKTDPAPKVEKETAPVKQTAPAKTFQPASKVTSKGVVTGPVTMPAVPTQTVEQVQVVDLTAPVSGVPAPQKKTEEPTILERHQNRNAKTDVKSDVSEDKVAEAVAKIEASGIEPAAFEPGAAEDVLKKILPFAPGQTELPEDDIAAVSAGILKELEKRDLWRIQIRSYATSQGEGVSSDKRISLSRAIALRHALVKQGVRSSRIDVRAEGQQPSQAGLSGDRIDLYLYSPTDKPQVF